MAKRTTETEVGLLSQLVSKLWLMKAERILAMVTEEGMDADIAIDDSTLQKMGKWVLDNGIIAAPDVENESSALYSKIEEIKKRRKGSVINFRAEASERGIG